MTLTGFPSDIIYNNKMSPKVLWEYLKEATRVDSMIVATVNSSIMGLTKRIRKEGLPNHLVCRIIETVEIETTFKTTVKLIKVQKLIRT